MSDRLEQAAKEAAAEIVHEFGVAEESRRDAYRSLSARIIYEHFDPVFAELETEAAGLRGALEAIASGAPTSEPERYEGDNHGDSWNSGYDFCNWSVATIARAALSGTAGQSLLKVAESAVAYRERKITAHELDAAIDAWKESHR